MLFAKFLKTLLLSSAVLLVSVGCRAAAFNATGYDSHVELQCIELCKAEQKYSSRYPSMMVHGETGESSRGSHN